MTTTKNDAGEGNALSAQQMAELGAIVEEVQLRQQLLVRMLAAMPPATALPAGELLVTLAPQAEALEQAAHIARLAVPVAAGES